jgi:hypothetical protein
LLIYEDIGHIMGYIDSIKLMLIDLFAIVYGYFIIIRNDREGLYGWLNTHAHNISHTKLLPREVIRGNLSGTPMYLGN